jgi:hypothetical protein
MLLKQIARYNCRDQVCNWVVIATDLGHDSVDHRTIYRLDSPPQCVAKQTTRDCSNKELMPL